MRLIGKKVIVTGANRSIGKAIALLFAKEGAELVISYRSDKKGAEEVIDCIKKTSGSATALYADFSTYGGIEQFYKESVQVLGQIDVLINNAGGFNTQSFFELKHQDFEKLLQVTLMTPFYLSQLVAKGMLEKQIRGNIINISSISGARPSMNRIAHASAKAALNMLTQSMALELAQHGIRVNAIAPGYTPYENLEFDSAIKDIPLGRAGLPSDQASTALFLATEESSWMTGQILTIDGGHSIPLSITKNT
ncbi:MAG: SDR family oxidoreductase [Parachlamydiaceae bacterium]|nr:SDR family oxidoreductase [Parachlamydiaceae bacterium]